MLFAIFQEKLRTPKLDICWLYVEKTHFILWAYILSDSKSEHIFWHILASIETCPI